MFIMIHICIYIYTLYMYMYISARARSSEKWKLGEGGKLLFHEVPNKGIFHLLDLPHVWGKFPTHIISFVRFPSFAREVPNTCFCSFVGFSSLERKLLWPWHSNCLDMCWERGREPLASSNHVRACMHVCMYACSYSKRRHAWVQN